MNKIGPLIRGQISKKTLTHYLIPLGIGIFYFFLFLAYLFFPYNESYPYNWTTSMISRLGWPEGNPGGWPFFSIAFILTGVLIIPLISYKYQRYSKLNKFAAGLIRILMLGFSISMILLGAIPNFDLHIFFGISHLLNALILIGGGSLMVLISWILISKEYFKNKQNESTLPGKLVIPYFFLCIFGAICIGMIVVSFSQTDTSFGHYIHDPATPLLLSPPLWEWLIMGSLIFLIVLPCYFLPAE